MEKKCIGCGVTLQQTNSDEVGYVNDLSMDYCKRCFQMIHYDKHASNETVVPNSEIIDQLATLSGTFVWIIDIFDLETSLMSLLKDFYTSNDCVIVFNKCDLLPSTINYQKLKTYLISRLNKLNIKFKLILTRGVNDDFIDNFKSLVTNEQPVIITGVANVGKSTIINELVGENVLTTNRYPATTLKLNKIEADGWVYYDTCGLFIDYSMQVYLNNHDLKTAIANKKVRPTVFQLTDDQSLIIGGLVKFDISKIKKATVVVYMSNLLEIHRCKKANSDEYMKRHYSRDLQPKAANCKLVDMKKVSFTHARKADYFVCGLGFITIVSNECLVNFTLYNKVQVVKREAMI